MAEYREEYIYDGRYMAMPAHTIEFLGTVEIETTSPKNSSVQVDMSEVARMKAEYEAKLESGSFWS
jgi:hypothetical protein